MFEQITAYYLLSSAGGPGSMSDQDLQDGAPATAAAGGPVGGAGKCHSPDPLGETYQRAAGPHGGPSGLCLNCGQLCGPSDEDTLALLHHPAPHPPAGLLVEKLGRTLRLHTSCAAVSGVTRLKSPFVTLLTRLLLPRPCWAF